MAEQKMRPLWSYEPCANCGMEGYATRTEARPASDKYLCPECETWERAAKEFAVQTKELCKENAKLRRLLQRMLDSDHAVQTAWSRQIRNVLK